MLGSVWGGRFNERFCDSSLRFVSRDIHRRGRIGVVDDPRLLKRLKVGRIGVELPDNNTESR